MAYNTSNQWKNKVYGGDKRFVPYLLIDNNYVPAEQISNIDFINNIIDDQKENLYIGTFISNQIDIKFKNLDNLNIVSNNKVYLEIGLNTDYISIDGTYTETDENGYKHFRLPEKGDWKYFKENYYINIQINDSKYEKIKILEIGSDEEGNYFVVDLYQASEISSEDKIKILPYEYIPMGYYLIDILDENYYETCKITCLDYAILMKSNVDYKEALDENGEIRIEDLLIWLCNYYHIELGTYPDVNRDVKISVYDSTLSGKTYISYIAELMGGNAKINRNNQLCIIPLKTDSVITIDALRSKDFKLTENYEISRVFYTDGSRVFENGESNKNTLQIRQENMFVIDNKVIENIYNSVVGLNIWSLENKNVADPSLDCWDIITFELGDLQYKTYNNFTINYSGSMMTNINTKIPTKQQEETTNVVKADDAVNIKKIQTEINQLNGTFKILAEDLKETKDNLDKNYVTEGQVSELIYSAENGLLNTFTTIGGDNIFRNTGLWFSKGKSIWEYWEGNAELTYDNNSTNGRAIMLLSGTFQQNEPVKNGKYTVSFMYKKLVPLSNVSVNINGVDYKLNNEDYTNFIETIEVSAGYIDIKFKSDFDNSCIVYDLMANVGETKLPYNQNQNETTTDTVQISKGITIKSTEKDTTFKADADGIRIKNNNDNTTTEFTNVGMETRQAKIVDQAEITGILITKVEDQTWISWLE